MKIKFINLLIQFFTAIGRFSKSRLDALYEFKYFTQFEERKDDIYIVTYPKSGTTWVQMILYVLINQKEPDFNHIYDVSPWLSNEAFKRKSVERVNKLPSPRFFKSHDRYEKFTSGFEGKIIYVYRDMLDLTVSYYYHKKYYNDSEITIDQLIDDSFNSQKPYNWFTFHKNWLLNKNKHPIFYISYEKLKSDFEEAIIQIAGFLNIKIDVKVVEMVKKYASFEYMKNNEIKFGEQPEHKHQAVFNQFIRKGKVGEGKLELTENQKQKLIENYNKIIAPILKN